MNVPTAARVARASKIFDISDTSKRKSIARARESADTILPHSPQVTCAVSSPSAILKIRHLTLGAISVTRLAGTTATKPFVHRGSTPQRPDDFGESELAGRGLNEGG